MWEDDTYSPSKYCNTKQVDDNISFTGQHRFTDYNACLRHPCDLDTVLVCCCHVRCLFSSTFGNATGSITSLIWCNRVNVYFGMMIFEDHVPLI